MRGQDLRWARRFDGWPARIARPRPRRGSAKALGLAYEAQLAGAIGPGAVHGQWWEFEDSSGHGFCQTDILIEGSGRALVLEVKYSWLLEAHEKLERLYVPVVSAALGKPAFGLVVAKRLVPEIRQAEITYKSDLAMASAAASAGRACLHWLGPGHPVMAARAG